jgi:hypothetical protein
MEELMVAKKDGKQNLKKKGTTTSSNYTVPYPSVVEKLNISK